MAKRTEEKPFRPLESSLVQGVMYGNAAAAVPPAEPPRGEQVRETEPRVIQVSSPTPRQLQAEPPLQQRQPYASEPLRRSLKREASPSTVSPLAERMEREKRVLLTASEERALERVVANIGAELGTSLKLSHVLRSCIRLVIAAEGDLVERARATGRTVRPPNGDLAAIEGFEKVVAAVLQAGIRSSRPIR